MELKRSILCIWVHVEERYTLGPLTYEMFKVTDGNLHTRSVPEPVLDARDIESNNVRSLASESHLLHEEADLYANVRIP